MQGNNSMAMGMGVNTTRNNGPTTNPMYGYQPMNNSGGMSSMPHYMNSNMPLVKPNPMGYFGGGPIPGSMPGGSMPGGMSSMPNPSHAYNQNYVNNMNPLGYNMPGQPQHPQSSSSHPQGSLNFNPSYPYMMNNDQYQNPNK